MFDKFGEFDSAEDMNKVAEDILKNGNKKDLLKLAEENGIDKEDAEDYIDGITSEFATPLMAARGKLEVESKDLDIKGMLTDWRDMILKMCMDDQKICVAVRKKGKSLKECMAKMIAYSFDNKMQISSKIVDATMVTHNGKKVKLKGPIYIGFPNRMETKKLIEEYYLN